MISRQPSGPAAPSGHELGLLGVWHGVEPGAEDAFDEWYDRQHHLERVGVPGFLRARRYVNLSGGPRYFNRYDVTGTHVLASADYLDRLNHPTEWTRSMLPRYRDTTRAVFHLAARAGVAEGADLLTLRIPHSAAAPLEGWLRGRDDAVQETVADRGVLRMECWSTDTAVSGLRSEERRLRPDGDAIVAQAVLIEGSNIDRVAAAFARHLQPLVPPGTIVDHYRLVFDLRRS
jgi:hypothetical protein